MRRWLTGLGLWTLFVWTTRIDNVLSQDDLTTAGRAARLALALSFTVVGVALLAVAWRARGRPLSRVEAVVIDVGCWWTIGVWVLRGVQISLGDHDAAFIIVHAVLGIVSIALAAVTLRSTTMPLRHGTTGNRRAEDDVTT
jgi:hypothetical protein